MNKKDAQKIIRKISDIQHDLFEIERKLFDEFFLEDEVKKIKKLYTQNKDKDFSIADAASRIYNIKRDNKFNMDFEEKESKVRIAFAYLLDKKYLVQVRKKIKTIDEIITYELKT